MKSRKYVVGYPSILDYNKLLQNIEVVLKSGVLTNNGPEVIALENLFCKVHDVPYSIAFCNATVALEAILAYLSIKGPVNVPSFTFIGVPQAVLRSGNSVNFADIDNNFFIGTQPNNNYSIQTNLFGNLSVSPQNSISIYDSAHCVGMPTGNNGICEFFSLHTTKIINSVEGGIVTTNNKELANTLRQYRNFGYTYGNTNPHGEIAHAGTNFKMSELHAVIGRTNLENIKQILSHYYWNWLWYSMYLPKWIKLRTPNTKKSNYSYIVCEVDEDLREGLVSYLNTNSVIARKYFPASHLEPIYNKEISLPNTERLSKRVFQLPTGLAISKEDIIYICNIIKAFPQ